MVNHLRIVADNTAKLPEERSEAKDAPQPKGRLSKTQRSWLERGLEQPGGKLPLFDTQGQRVSSRTVMSCLKAGWAEHWFTNPIKPDWQVCKLTDAGRALFSTA